MPSAPKKPGRRNTVQLLEALNADDFDAPKELWLRNKHAPPFWGVRNCTGRVVQGKRVDSWRRDPRYTFTAPADDYALVRREERSHAAPAASPVRPPNKAELNALQKAKEAHHSAMNPDWKVKSCLGKVLTADKQYYKEVKVWYEDSPAYPGLPEPPRMRPIEAGRSHGSELEVSSPHRCCRCIRSPMPT